MLARTSSATRRSNCSLSRPREAPASIANSSGIFLGQRFHYDLARPGAAQVEQARHLPVVPDHVPERVLLVLAEQDRLQRVGDVGLAEDAQERAREPDRARVNAVPGSSMCLACVLDDLDPGSRSDGMHMTGTERFGDFGRVRFEWAIPFTSLPRAWRAMGSRRSKSC